MSSNINTILADDFSKYPNYTNITASICVWRNQSCTFSKGYQGGAANIMSYTSYISWGTSTRISIGNQGEEQRYPWTNVPKFDVSSITVISHESEVRVMEAPFINSMWSSGANRRHRSGPALSRVMADGIKPLHQPMLTSHRWAPATFVWAQFHSKCPSCYSVQSVSIYNFQITATPHGTSLFLQHSLSNPVNHLYRDCVWWPSVYS